MALTLAPNVRLVSSYQTISTLVSSCRHEGKAERFLTVQLA
jgi:hypothetical protein